MEEEVRRYVLALEYVLTKLRHDCDDKLKKQALKLEGIKDKINELNDKYSDEIQRIRDLCTVQMEVMQKNCNNLINQADAEAKHSAVSHNSSTDNNASEFWKIVF